MNHEPVTRNQRDMKTTPGIFTFALLLLFVASCTTERPSKPSATGRAGELLVVMEPRMWDGKTGDAFRRVFRDTVQVLNQVEPMFDVIFIPKRDFAKIFETHRHIFFLDIDNQLSAPTIEISRDVWSYPQLVVRVKAPDEDAAVRIIENNAETFYERYLSVEFLRLQNAYSRMLNTASVRAVKEMFGVEMTIPEGFFVASQGDNFIWLRKSATNEEFDLAVMIWTLDYTDPAIDFDEDMIWARRDSITRQYIPGQFPDTYMTTYNGDPGRGELYFRPQFKEISLNDKYAIEARSLWRVQGDFMGGPFVTYTFVDEATNRLFMIDAWVFAPNYLKRDYMRQVEAIIWSVKFPVQDEL
jgi:hypothetical protein